MSERKQIKVAVIDMNNGFPNQGMRGIQELLNSYKEKNIGFDYKFNLSDNENLYCSEFVAKILNELNTFHYSFFRKQTKHCLRCI